MRIPEPTPGLVVSYSYVWRREAARGMTEGLKHRPCAIVLAARRLKNGATEVSVAPITHSPPVDPSTAVEIPAQVKRALGLDTERSWIILDEFNTFSWPGFDLCPADAGASTCAYGFLPPAFFVRLTTRMAELRSIGKVWVTPRDE